MPDASTVRQLEHLSAKGVSGWLNILPLKEHGFSLSSCDFRDAIALRNLSHNQLASLPTNVFANLSRLSTLHLEYNQLASLPTNVFANLPRLSVLFLVTNPLASLPSNVFANLSALQFLYIQNNSLTVDHQLCRAFPQGRPNIPTFVADSVEYIKSLNSTVCSQSCDNAPKGEFTCNTGYRCIGALWNYTCHNIDECVRGNHACHYNAMCNDTVGNFTCTCNAGYYGDGGQCTVVTSDSPGMPRSGSLLLPTICITMVTFTLAMMTLIV
ncbi:slit homolog 1 protein-like [Sycon ciliatum]|uniref:slit homolog 1 protein-like n=1 Tax=Sycon ciliatum TaxID=27933 RepID=UPI0031F71950